MNDLQLLDKSWEDLRLQMDRHRRLVHSALEGRAENGTECFWSICPHRQILMDLALHTVQVLDETRKSFKSKRLEELRKYYLRVLSEDLRGGQPVIYQSQE